MPSLPESVDWMYTHMPRPVANTIVFTSIVGSIGGAAFVSTGLIANGDPLSTLKSFPEKVGNVVNICDAPDENKKDAIRAAIEEGRSGRFDEKKSVLEIPQPGDITLLDVLSTPDLSHAKSLLGKTTIEYYDFETTYGDDSQDPNQIKKDVNELAQTLLRTPPSLIRGAKIKTVELNSSGTREDLGRYMPYNAKIDIKSGAVLEAFSHEVGHSIQAAVNDKRCWLPSTRGRNFEAVNPPGFSYGKSAVKKIPTPELRKITLTDYGATGGSAEEAGDILEIIQNTNDDLKYFNDRRCVLGRAAITDAKIVLALMDIEEMAEGVGKAYAKQMGIDSVAPYCQK